MALARQYDACKAGTTEFDVTSDPFDAAAGEIISILASSNAGSGSPDSGLAISDNTAGVLTWTQRVAMSRAINPAEPFAPPLYIWTAVSPGLTGIEVTTTITGTGGGFAHYQQVDVHSGQDVTTPVADTDFLSTTSSTPTLNMTAPVAGCDLLAMCVDWFEESVAPTAQLGTTTDCSIASGDTQANWRGHKFNVGPGAVDIGATTAAGDPEINMIGILLQPAAEETVTGVLDVTLPVPIVDFAAEATSSGVLDVILPVVDADFDGESSSAGTLDVAVPLVQVAFDGVLSSAGTLDINLPVVEVALDGELSSAGQLDLVLPVPDVNLVGEVPVSGTLNITLPVPETELHGISAAGGATMGPCGWTIPDPLCSDTWDALPANVKAAARDYAALILWGATGREFGLCEVTVKPCRYEQCGSDLWNFFGWSWASGTWMPYIFQGQWFNCMCPGVCCCDPRCQIRLMGDVQEIIEVLIDGIAVDPATYFVNDKTWLVRAEPDCWPDCSNQNTPEGGMSVTYLRGNPVPAALLAAAAILADEYGKACVGAECRLSNRVTSLARNGIQIDMLSPEDLMEGGLTGIWEVDTVVRAINPHRRVARGQIFSPGLKPPRMTTWP